MNDLINAILKLNPTVTVIRGDVAYDADGNEVAYDKAAVQAYVDAHAYIAKPLELTVALVVPLLCSSIVPLVSAVCIKPLDVDAFNVTAIMTLPLDT